MDVFITIFVLGVTASFFYGLFLALFKKGRRKRGVKVVLSSVFVLFIGLLSVGLIQENSKEGKRAAELGFESLAEMKAAEAEGIFDAEVWVEHQAKRELEAQQKEQERREAEAREEQERREAEAREEQEERRKGFHCLSAWDGSHQVFKRSVRDSMRNQSSFEHMETRITPVNEKGQHTLLMKYRAENGFGGMNVGVATGLVDSKTCRATILSIE
tara:strand:- start:9912 stop:10556 length:645 start_codon:yes stop_codon:yes gene_type:complete